MCYRIVIVGVGSLSLGVTSINCTGSQLVMIFTVGGCGTPILHNRVGEASNV